MTGQEDIPSTDLAVISYTARGNRYLGLLKLNYIHSFMHRTEEEAGSNQIIQHRTTLPPIGQTIKEAALINMDTLDIYLLEKRYAIRWDKGLLPIQ